MLDYTDEVNIWSLGAVSQFGNTSLKLLFSNFMRLSDERLQLKEVLEGCHRFVMLLYIFIIHE